ncbi:late control protein D [Paracoccus pantotrophus]|uniref:Late control protein D n=1 Tax=Paracoccus pantotrophus TaxID=82367 RepID=A0AAE6NVY9_PARPN|nr:late control protein D [Paracoccus pantotrophus]
MEGSAPELKGTWHPKSVSHRLDGGLVTEFRGERGKEG